MEETITKSDTQLQLGLLTRVLRFIYASYDVNLEKQQRDLKDLPEDLEGVTQAFASQVTLYELIQKITKEITLLEAAVEYDTSKQDRVLH